MNVQKQDRQVGFTLVELMVVVVILGLLGGIGAVAFKKFGDTAKLDIAKSRCAELTQSIDAFTIRDGTPPADEVWENMIDKGLVKRRDLKDPWGEEFMVREDDDGELMVISKGPDKSEDTEDDIGRNGNLSEQEDF